MEELPYEILQQIILNISLCSTNDASNVCKIWKKIFNDNYLTIHDNKIIINDTFMLNKYLCEIRPEELRNDCSKGGIYDSPIEIFLKNNEINKILTKKCVSYIAQFFMSLSVLYCRYETVLIQLCVTNNLLAIKFRDFVHNRQLYGEVDYIEMLDISLEYNAFDLINYFTKYIQNIDGWIEYCCEYCDDYNRNNKIILSLDYLVSIKAINLRYFHNKITNMCIREYIENKYF